MGFLNVLKSIGKGALGIAGVPGEILGAQQGAAAQGRKSQAELQQGQDRNALTGYGINQGAETAAGQTDLARKKYRDDARGQAATRAVVAGLLGGGGMGSSISVPGIRSATVSGGPMAALAANPGALDTLRTLQDQSNEALRNPAPFEGGTVLKPPPLTPLPEEGKGNNFLDTLARILQISGAVGGALPGTKKPGFSDDTLP